MAPASCPDPDPAGAQLGRRTEEAKMESMAVKRRPGAMQEVVAVERRDAVRGQGPMEKPGMCSGIIGSVRR